ncbi:MAG: 4Fe-4S binding protein, partial [Chitinophagales bacterium]
EGLVGYVGISTHGVAGAELVLKHPELEVLLPIVNQVGRGLRNGTMAGMIEVTRAAYAAGKATYAMKVLAGGHLVGEFQQHLQWGRQLGCLHAITVGMKTVDEVEADVAVFEEREVPPHLAQTLAGQKRIKVLLGQCAGCGSCVAICPAGALKVNAEAKAECDHSLCILCGYCGSACPKFAIRLV